MYFFVAVLKQLIARCQDVSEYNPALHLTVFQFRYFVRSKECSFQTRLEEINDEVQMIESLLSQNLQQIKKAITRLSLMGVLPNINILLKMSHLVVDPSEHPSNPRLLVTSFLRNSSKDLNLRLKVTRHRVAYCIHLDFASDAFDGWFLQLLDSYIEGLESAEAKDRQGSCEVLGILQDPSVVSQLAYIAQSDPSSDVK